MPLPFDMATGYDSGGRAFPKPAITRGFSYKLPDRIEDLKLAVHVTYWDYSSVSKSVEPLAAARLAYVSKVIRGLNSLSSKTDVFIHTNAVRLTLEGTFALVHHDMSDQDGYSLSWKSRDLMLSSYKEYDAIMYMEDDILFQDNNLAYWYTNHSRCSKAGYYLGFVRTETDSKKLYCTDISPVFGPCQPLRHSVVLEGEALYINDVNLYSGLWILDRAEFEWFSTHPYFDLNECPFFYPYKRETSAVGAIPMFKGSLIAADFKNSLVPHIPNSYIGSEKYCKVTPNEVFCVKKDDGSKLSGKLGIFYTNNNSPCVIKTLDNLKNILESRFNFDIIACSQKDLPCCSFPVVPSLFKESSWVNLAIQILQALYKGREASKYKYVSFLEHDVMYSPDYFDYSDFDTDVLQNVNYRGVCAFGYQYYGGPFPVLSQMTVKLEYAIDHFEKFLLERVAGIVNRNLEPSGSVTKYSTSVPTIHINRESFTGHGSYFTINYLDQEIPYWGHYSNLWTV